MNECRDSGGLPGHLGWALAGAARPPVPRSLRGPRGRTSRRERKGKETRMNLEAGYMRLRRGIV